MINTSRWENISRGTLFIYKEYRSEKFTIPIETGKLFKKINNIYFPNRGHKQILQALALILGKTFQNLDASRQYQFEILLNK